MLDPYIGSGTTAVAAKLLGHRYIGIDRSQAYIQMAQERLDNAQAEMKAIRKEIDLRNIETTFSDRKSKGMNVGKHRAAKKPTAMTARLID